MLLSHQRTRQRCAYLRAWWGLWFFVVAAGLYALDGRSEEQSYWLRNGATNIRICPGSEGRPFKAANRNGQWIYLTGIIECSDIGDAYRYHVKYLQVRINPGSRARIERPTLVFDWLGLALYRPDDADDRIDWLFDDAFPVHGILHQDSDEAIYFGDIAFTVGKSATERATNFTFYLTSEGILYVFGLL